MNVQSTASAPAVSGCSPASMTAGMRPTMSCKLQHWCPGCSPSHGMETHSGYSREKLLPGRRLAGNSVSDLT